MSKLQRRIGRERQTLVDARDVLGRRKNERTVELDRYLSSSASGRRRCARHGAVRASAAALSELERDEKSLNDRIVALERARREAESSRRRYPAAAITTADWASSTGPCRGASCTSSHATGPNNTRLPWHGIGIAAPAGHAVRAIRGGHGQPRGNARDLPHVVLVDHGGGYYSFYGYLSDATVAPRRAGHQGQILGHVGGGSSDQDPSALRDPGPGRIALDPSTWLKTRR